VFLQIQVIPEIAGSGGEVSVSPDFFDCFQKPNPLYYKDLSKIRFLISLQKAAGQGDRFLKPELRKQISSPEPPGLLKSRGMNPDFSQKLCPCRQAAAVKPS